jgi:DNA-binding LacI/PurR family transcriptional regulator
MRATPDVRKCLAESGVRHVCAFGDKPEDRGTPWIRFSMNPSFSRFADHCANARVKRVVQVRFEENEMFDAQPALAKKGIKCSWLEIPRGDDGSRAFEDSMRRAYETFAAMPRERIPDLLLFWNSFLAQGAVTAFLARGIRMPEDVKAVSLASVGLGPVYPRPFTRIEIDPVEAGEKMAAYALAVLAKGRVPRPPLIAPKYVFGSTFPY